MYMFSTDMIPRLDARKIVHRFGGRSELWRRLAARNHHVSIKTIEKWMERESIPSHRLLVLIDLAISEGKPLVLDDYVVRDNVPGSSNR